MSKPFFRNDDALKYIASLWMGKGGPIRNVVIVMAVVYTFLILFLVNLTHAPKNPFTLAIYIFTVGALVFGTMKVLTPERNLRSWFWWVVETVKGPRRERIPARVEVVLIPPARFQQKRRRRRS